MLKLNLGCGLDIKPGWTNVDGEASYKPNVVHDLSKGIPFDDGTADFIFCEHFLEHLSREQGVAYLRECRRVLKVGGVMRVSMPDLAEFCRRYQQASKNPELLREWWKEAQWAPRTPAQMMNEEFRMWGHQFIYDYEEARQVFFEAGFSEALRATWGQSEWAALRDLEVRPKRWYDLQLEAVR